MTQDEQALTVGRAGVPRETSRPVVVYIPGEPVAQGRPRFARVGRFVRAFDPAKSRKWKALAAHWMRMAQHEGVAFPDGAVRVSVTAVFACPKGDFRKVPLGRRLHARRPDAENVAKAALDAGSGVLWRDDAQVSTLVVVKRIGAQGEAPFVRVEVERE